MKRWSLLLLLVAGLAVAGTVNITDTYVFQALFKSWSRTTAQLTALTASAYAGYQAFNSSRGVLAVSDGVEWRSATPIVAIATWDFPALGTNFVNCSQTRSVTLTGALVTDECSLTSDFGLDGGSGLNTEIILSCEVTGAGTAKGRACVDSADGGSVNLADAGYTFRIRH